MKKAISFILILSTLLLTVTPVFAALPPTADPQYTNIASASASFTINNTGKATILFRVNGNASLTKTTVIAFLEKFDGFEWRLVDINDPDDIWFFSNTNRSFVQLFEEQLGSPGEYRLSFSFSFYGTNREVYTDTVLATY